MPSRTTGAPMTLFSDTDLQQEYEAVHQQVIDGLADLRPPLGDLVLGQVAESFQAQRVGLVLAASLPQQDTPYRREQRILLAAALEMLQLALRIHRLLFQPSDGADMQGMDRSWVGSIILAGDYCFSRSAILAAHTNEPDVVQIFARALQAVSEQHLRQLFHSPGQPYGGAFERGHPEQNSDQFEAGILTGAGLSAASRLAGLTKSIELQVDQRGWPRLSHPEQWEEKPPAFQMGRWTSLFFIMDQHANTE